MKLAILSNVNMDMLIGEVSKTHEVFSTAGYGQWVSYALEKNKELYSFEPKIIFLIIDGNALLEPYSDYSSGADEIHNCFNYIKRLAENYPYSTIAVSDIDVCRQRIRPSSEESIETLWEVEWMKHLSAAAKSANIIPFDLKSLIEKEGRKNFYSEKLWYTGSIPYGPKSFKPFLAALNDFIEKQNAVRKKVLILDLDNTLWGGVVGEDGAKGITLGQSLIGAAYRDAQKRIKEIAETGALLAIVSKNNIEDVIAVFNENTHMVLKESDFVSIKPIAENDSALICALLNLYRKLYRIIGCVIFGVGLCLSPFLGTLVKGDCPADVNLYILYTVYLLNNLITCELVCEGPTTMEIHKQYVEYLEKKFNSKIVEFTVRRKKDAWIPKYLYAKFENGKVFLRNFRRTEYCYAFKVYAKRSCYDCKFKGDNRKGDMTLGDFWGATPNDVFWNEKGVSSILVHREKAKKLLLETQGIKLFESDFARVTAENPMVIKSRKLRPERAKFEMLFKKHGLIYATKHSMKFKDRVAMWVKNHTPAFVEKLLKKLLGR